MADEDRTEEENQEEVEGEKSDKKPEKADKKPEKADGRASDGGILPWIIVFVLVVLCGSVGFLLGRLFAASRTPKPAEHSQVDQPAQLEGLKADAPATDSQEGWYYGLESVTANLDEPDVTRYVRAALILEINSEVDQAKGRVFLDEKKPLLTNWLTVYLASLSLEDIRGDRNLKRIQLQILNALNEKLFSDSKPYIEHILFKEFVVQ